MHSIVQYTHSMKDLQVWIAQLRKGIIEMSILLLLRHQSLHGYRIVQHLKDMGQLISGEGTVYPILRRLESDGFLVANWVHGEKGNPRKYYSITPKGIEFLSDALTEWEDLVASINKLKEGVNEKSGE